MENLLPKEEYLMVAVIGLDSSKIEEICKKLNDKGKFIVPANYNCSVQTVVSGTKEAVEEAEALLKEAGAKRVISLKTSGPFHTSKLEEAKEAYKKELEDVKFEKGNCKVIKNIDGTFYNENDDIKNILAEHIVNPVRFDKAIKLMEEQGIEEYIEIGPGKALTGFIKKDIKEAKTYNISSLRDLGTYQMGQNLDKRDRP